MSAEEKKLYITISDKRGDGDEEEIKPEEKKVTWQEYASVKLLEMVEQQTISTIQWGISNIGNFTGNYEAQRQAQFAMQSLNSLYSLSKTVITGFVATGGNPIGAVVGAGLSVLNQGINFAKSFATGMAANFKQNYEIEQIRNRSGLNSATNGSRGTKD